MKSARIAEPVGSPGNPAAVLEDGQLVHDMCKVHSLSNFLMVCFIWTDNKYTEERHFISVKLFHQDNNAKITIGKVRQIHRNILANNMWQKFTNC